MMRWTERNMPSQAKPVLLNDYADLVIVGSGIAGFTAAFEARRLAPAIRIGIITEQNYQTINTPALKQYVEGKLALEQLQAYPAGTPQLQRIETLQARVEEIHAQSKYVTLSDRRAIGYGSLLLCTGSAATGLPEKMAGRELEGVFTLHRLPEYIQLRRYLKEVERAVVVGGGMHAIETVMSLVELGIETYWLIRSDTFLPHILDQTASEMVLDRLWQTGAKVRTNTELVEILGKFGSVVGVVTNQQQFISCQLVIACTGSAPVTTLVQRCDLRLEHSRGIHVDNQLRTSLRDIYAAGDVAALKDPQTGLYQTRAQWYAAVQQGRAVAASITGTQPSSSQAFGVPWHATQMGKLSLLTVGHPLDEPKKGETLIEDKKSYYRRMTVLDDRLVGYLSLGPTQPDGLAIKQLIDEGLSIQGYEKALLKGTFDIRTYIARRPRKPVTIELEQQPPLATAATPVREAISQPLVMPVTMATMPVRESISQPLNAPVEQQQAPIEFKPAHPEAII